MLEMSQADTVLTNIKIMDNGGITSPLGFAAGGMHCGIKRKRNDLGWILSQVPATAAAVYTTNLFQAPPLKVTQESIQSAKSIQGVIVNSGNANACTGNEGLENAYLMRKWFAEEMNLSKEKVAVCSTGVIGEQLPIAKIKDGILKIKEVSQQNNVEGFEKAILTTDTFQKRACVELMIANKKITIGGVAKGSGMIHPNMATMLGFLTTDALVEPLALEHALKTVVDETFNMITVDGDTSTNDMVLLLANGLAENEMLNTTNPDWSLFIQGLKEVCESLAQQIARDGEGATKLIEVQVYGAKTKEDAKAVSKSIIGSNLLKAAIFGCDPNWGRIISAIGYSGAQINSEQISVSIGNIKVVENGMPYPFSEEDAICYLSNNETIQIVVQLEDGNERATAWGCDLTYDYVKINASYRT